MRSTKMVCLLALPVMAAGCGSTAPNPAHGLSVSFTTKPPLVASARPSFSLTVTSGTDVLVISRVQLVLSEIEMTHSSAVCTGGPGGADGDCQGLELAPMLLDLPVDGTLKTGFNTAIPEGSYSALDANIDAVTQDQSGASAFLAANPTFAGVSIRVEGTFNGAAFTYTTNTSGELELGFNPAMVVGKDGLNVSIDVNVSNWFKTSTGGLIDPSTAGPGGANASTVAGNIEKSFKAFEDDNQDGNPDH